MKRCRCCGRVHDQESWERLRYVGIMDDIAGGGRIELRDCVCTTTLAIEVTDEHERD